MLDFPPIEKLSILFIINKLLVDQGYQKGVFVYFVVWTKLFSS